MPEKSTTPDLVELAQQAFQARSRHDLDAVMCFYAPDEVLDMSTGGLGSYEGAAAIREFVESWWGSSNLPSMSKKENMRTAVAERLADGVNAEAD